MSGLLGSPLLRDLLVLGALLLGALGLWYAARAGREVSELRRRLAVLDRLGGGRDLLGALADASADLRALRADTGDALDELARARQESADAIRHLAVVRYDAPGALAPHQSFSLALLDAEGDGVVLSGVTGADGSRTYAKIVSRGHGDLALGPEEREAVQLARGEQDAAVRRR